MAKKKKKKTKEETKKKIKATLSGERVVSEMSKEAKELYDQSRYGEIKEKKIQYSLVEALYLLEKGRMEIKEDNKKITHDTFTKKATKIEPNFWIRYCVFRDMRNRGYIVKTALKFGADFRVYDRGIKPGQDHAKWILYPVHESNMMSWYDFSAKNRVAHSTRKNLLLAVVDNENDVTFYNIAWIRP